MIWKTKRGRLDLSKHGAIMGILNVTPDSFSDGGSYVAVDAAVERALEMEREGAAIIDIGGESTRPGAAAVSAAEELQRVLGVIEQLRARSEVLISIDTQKVEVAEAAIEAGVDIVNDVNGLRAEGMLALCVKHGVGVVVMHMQGVPETMQAAPIYEDVVAEVKAFFRQRYVEMMAAGMDTESIVFDPGIGFGKTVEHNLTLMDALPALVVYERPVLLGVSRKSIIGKLLEMDEVEDRDKATAVLTALARQEGCMLHRVHDVRGNRAAIQLVEFLGS